MEPEPKMNSQQHVTIMVPAGRASRAWARRLPTNILWQFISTIAIFLLFTFLSPTSFLTKANFQSLSYQIPEVLLLGLGVMFSMITGGIDLSLVAIANLVGIAATKFMLAASAASLPGSFVITGAVLLGVAVGVCCGLLNGVLVGILRITPILATLATFELFGGLAIAWSQGHSLVGIPSSYLKLSTQVMGIPLPLIVVLIITLLSGIVLNRSLLGLYMKYIGANPTAARYSGVNIPATLIGTYIISSILASAAGLLVIARTASATPDYGQSYLLLSVVIAVLGGVDWRGGEGTVTGVVLATLALTFLQSGFVLLGFSQFFYLIAQGIILIVALGIQTHWFSIVADKILSLAYRYQLARTKLERKEERPWEM